MIISEKQIMELITIAQNFRELMILTFANGKLPEYVTQHDSIGRLLYDIKNQQSEELKEIK